MKTYNCDFCNKEFERQKYLKRINGKWFCKDCYRNNRLNFREKTLENDQETKNEIEKLRRFEKNIDSMLFYERHKELKRDKKEDSIDFIPTIKNTNPKYKKKKSSCFLTLQERQNLLRMLMHNGMDFNNACERVNNLAEEQKKVREKMRKQNKSEEEIKSKQKELINDLYKW